jgi:hypothetical protein
VSILCGCQRLGCQRNWYWNNGHGIGHQSHWHLQNWRGAWASEALVFAILAGGLGLGVRGIGTYILLEGLDDRCICISKID